MFKMQNKNKVPSDGLKDECIPPCSRGGRVYQTHPARFLHVPRGAGDPGGHPAIPPETEPDAWLSLPAPSADLLCDLEPGIFVSYPGKGRKKEGRKLHPKEIERFAIHCSGARKLQEIINRKG